MQFRCYSDILELNISIRLTTKMRITNYSCALLLLLTLLVFSACSPYPAADYYETDGIISIDFTDEDKKPNWKPVRYLNSSGLLSDVSEPDSSVSLNSSFYLSNAGRYSFWILGLGLPSEENGSHSSVAVTVTGPDGFLTEQFQVELSSGSRLQWSNYRSEEGDTGMITLRESGHYSIRIHTGGSDGIQIHKLQMSFNDFAPPSGLGLPASISPEINAAVLFREQQVMLPPDWYFGTILGFGNAFEEPFDPSSSEEISWPFIPDAFWRSLQDNNSGLNQINLFDESGVVQGLEIEADDLLGGNSGAGSNIFEAGYQFLKVTGHITPGQTENLNAARYQAFSHEERSFVFRGLEYAFDPASLRYPALTSEPGGVDWSRVPKVSDHSFHPGGLHEVLETYSKPILSTYNTPFLSLPVDIDSGNTGTGSDTELMIRRIQLASFMPVMHLITNENQATLFSSADESVMDALNEYSTLRSRLFPYIYTHAHVTRQTGEGIVRGFRDRENQYRFGDAFLVAPVTEPGIRELSVYFPGDGTWYDYHSGRRYAAGQSWVVEAPLRQLPLFVKAGSVIPYRTESGQIRKGSNDNLLVEIYTGDAGTFRLTEDDGQSRDYRRARAARTMFRYNEVAGQLRLTIGAVQSEFEGMSDFRSYELHFKHTSQPREVTINENVIAENSLVEADSDISWHYDEETSSIIIHMKNQWKHERTEIAISP